MIQRIQSILLFFASITAIILLFIPIGHVYTDQADYIFDAFFLKENIPNGDVKLYTFYIAIMLIISAFLSFYTIFQYKNRRRQLKLNAFNLMLFLIIIVFMLYICPDFIFVQQGISTTANDFRSNPWIMTCAIPAFFIYMSTRAIRKDEKKIRAADRLR